VHVCGIYLDRPSLIQPHTGNDNVIKKNIRLRLDLYDSEYVARRTVDLAKHPRRSLILPWWFHPSWLFDMFFPGLVDWFLKVTVVKRLA